MTQTCWEKHLYNLEQNLVNIIEAYLEDDEEDVKTFVKKYLKKVE